MLLRLGRLRSILLRQLTSQPPAKLHFRVESTGTVRIQSERGHQVVSSGPYRFVRHPGYAGALWGFLAVPVWLDSAWAFLPALLLMGILVLRTALEDKTLQAELPGYKEFTQKTRYRLLPGIW